MNFKKFVTTKHLSICFLCIIASPTFGQSEAEVHPFMEDPFILHLGAFLPKRDVDIAVDGNVTGPHPPLDFESQLGVSDTDDLFTAEFIWRFGEKWSFRGQYFKADSAVVGVVEEDLVWGDVILEQGSSIGAGNELEVERLFFAYELSNSLQHNFGIGLGFHRLVIGGFIEGNLIVNGEEISDDRRGVSTVAPLPNVGAWYAYSPSRKWVFDARVDWLDAEVGDLSGGLLNLAAGANYQIFDHFGLGIKYQIFRLKLGINKADWKGDFDVKYEGFYFYLSANWN
jgi:hypothetical protein